MIYLRLTLSLLTSIAMSTSAVAQQIETYTVPRTAHGHPDFQAVWGTEFLTLLERPPGVEELVAGPELAKALVAGAWTELSKVVLDPDVYRYDIRQLAMVRGEYRTSIIVEPENGKLPYTQAGIELADWALARDTQMFDHAGQRPLVERCMESLAYPPIRPLPVFVPLRIFQTRDHVVILSEDAVGLRIIGLRSEPLPDAVRSIEGYPRGRWEGDTLVVKTTNLRAEDPARFVVGRPLLLSRDTEITERFTRVSETELVYRFTVEDAELYTEPWTGEFSMFRHDVPMFEYACHEGNYSMPNVLRGGQAEAARLEAERARE